MVGKVDYSSVPTTVDLDNSSSQKKYTVNPKKSSSVTISKALCTLMAIGAVLLAVLVGLIVFFTVARCNQHQLPNQTHTDTPESLIFNDMMLNDGICERLPTNVRPLHYDIQIHPNYEKNVFNGLVNINVNISERTNQIVFHLDKIKILQEKLSIQSLNNSNTDLKIAEKEYIDGQRYRILLNVDLNVDEHYKLTIGYEGELNQQLQGFYGSEYEDEVFAGKQFVYSTQFSPTDARKAFPCFDEPSFKATFSIAIARPGYLRSISNMPLLRTQPFANHTWYWDYFQETPKMSTYLVAFVVNNLQRNNHTDESIVRIWSRSIYSKHVEYAEMVAKRALEFFEDYFQMRFPLEKIDIVALPQFGFQAMENWGLIASRESSLLFDEKSSTVLDKRTIATVLAHELAHQWFGNLVTPKWWNDLWLKEGFATYLQYFAVNNIEPTWNIVEEFVPMEVHRAFAMDSLQSTRPISFAVRNSQQIRQTFDAISYAKGASIIRMMANFLGEDTFKRGLLTYLRKFQYGNADRHDLFTSLMAESDKNHNESIDLKVVMNSWTEQAGFPVLTLIADRANNKLTIRQKRFLFTDKPSPNLWWIPVSFTTSSTPNFSKTQPQFWLKNEREIHIDLDFTENQWYLLNLQQTGYYIVNYDEQNWRSIINNIMTFPTIIRAQLISDSMDLARANLLDYDIPLRLISQMVFKDRVIWFVPFMTVLNKFEFLHDMLINTPCFGLFTAYHTAILENVENTVDLSMNINDDYLSRRIRSVFLQWACRRSDSRCDYQAREKFRNLVVHQQEIPPDLRDVVYCTAIRDGAEPEWTYAFNRLTEHTSISEKNILLDALGCTRIKWLLSRYLNYLISENSSIKIQDADRVFEAVARNPYGTEIAFNFLRDNWTDLTKRYGDGFNVLARMVRAIAPHLNTRYQLNELKRFRDSVNGNLSTTIQSFDNSIEIVYTNVLWMEKNYESIEKWLEQNKLRFKYL